MSQHRTLVLLTQKFPFESGEEFLATELTHLEQAFDRVIIIPTAVRDFSHQRATGKNTQIRIVKNPDSAKAIATAFISRFFQTLSLLSSELNKSGWNLKLLKYYFYHIPFALQIKSIISKELDSTGVLVLYSYWMDTNAFASSLFKNDSPEIKLVVKSHGGDLYNERQPSGAVAFRETVYAAADSLIFISEHGYNYASTHYPKYASKMKVFRLGVEDNATTPTFDFSKSFHIVSCSSLIPLKRVNLIAEVLNNCSVPINWTHFGGEESAITALKNSLPKLRNDMEITWKGKVKNEKVQSYYASQPIDLLINLSSSEGIPVSMMEALSFGIPVFANAVGGISEVVQTDTGMLIPDGLSAIEIASRLDQFLLSGKTRNEEFRIGVRRFWYQNYSAEQNHQKLITHLNTQTFTRSFPTE
ncbi:glycosyltransferase [Algoriphagus persicinus]|uniref:glycosyltransferase n=1 Tax=Algoriphagus persicinus TaxID=3108754 RepID=UPI002B3D1699|nr:glycosyltransferase [Algoriphagus sp. E1-3-M2]MEB2785153.1 glycosyltransferase [Algoriphagus sp. E1-3-M2]